MKRTAANTRLLNGVLKFRPCTNILNSLIKASKKCPLSKIFRIAKIWELLKEATNLTKSKYFMENFK
jgi:hypothetical protein